MAIGDILGMHALNNDFTNDDDDPDNDALGHLGVTTEQLMNRAADAGASSVRIPLSLYEITGPDVGDWQHAVDRAKQLISHAATLGLKIIFEPGQTPRDLLPSGAGRNTPPDPSVLPQVAERFGLLVEAIYSQSSLASSVIEAWEIGNEPNLTYDYNGLGVSNDIADYRWYVVDESNAELYAQYLAATAQAIEAAAGSNVKVIAAGIAHNDPSYMERMFSTLQSLGADIDGFAIHPYTTHSLDYQNRSSGRATDWVPNPERGNAAAFDYNFSFQGALHSIQGLANQYGFGSAELYITEFGVPSYLGVRGAGEAGRLDQAYWITEALGVLDSWGNDNLSAVIAHMVLDSDTRQQNNSYNTYDSDSGNDGNSPIAEGSFGFYERDQSTGQILAKPIVAVMQSIAAGVDYSSSTLRIISNFTSSVTDVSTRGTNGVGIANGYFILTHGGADTVSGSAYDDSLFLGDGNDTGDGNAGADRIYGGRGNDTLRGRAGDDDLYGNKGDDTLIGGGDTNRIDGGVGLDVVVLAGSQSAYTWSGNGLSVSITATDGSGTTTAINVERLRFSNGEIALANTDVNRGNGGVTTDPKPIYGGAGNNSLVGATGADTIYGRDGNDTLAGGAGADSLFGEAGDDLLEGDGGADRLNGGTGYDSAVYWNSSAGIVADLRTPTRNTGEAAGDVYFGIEGLQGSVYGDELAGTISTTRCSGRMEATP